MAMKFIVCAVLLVLGTAIQAKAQELTWWDEFSKIQAAAYDAGKAERTENNSQKQVLFCKAYWEGYSEVLFDGGTDHMIGNLTPEEVYSAVDYWAARLEEPDYEAEKTFADEAYYALIYFGPSEEQKLAATKKLGACEPYS
ncbi:MAG: hypothetical protein NXH70_09465 [Hyphomonas sp.]|jgi:hypothetical protein|nr:hypothetical protein [Hyphomonas sp.]